MSDTITINTMKCPFRVDEHGEFRDCYGKDCMAYYEFECLTYPDSNITSFSRPVKCVYCKRMDMPVTYNGCV